ncbi:tyrosine-type recombinase/integrase [Thalassorhabdomicrobium marinisediminis]|nr:tyrosine-type recombinase/integrase [Thalassorhabdomicrobium marinisediminis]
MNQGIEGDIRPLALRFLLLTCARLDELVVMKWNDFKEDTLHWHKPAVKTVRGKPRQQYLPLSGAAVALLTSLPNYGTWRKSDLVFPNSAGHFLGNWHRITKAVHRESQTDNWHRHDLRRTGASIMKALGVAPRTVDEILAHRATHRDEGTSAALENYFASTHLLEHVVDPQRAAFDKLAEALDYIERSGSQFA